MRVAAGFLLFTEGPEGPRFLLLRNARHGTWGFPKGHLDRGESPEQAAWRELAEETGLTREDVEVLPGFEETTEYRLPPPKAKRKRVHMYLARARSEAFTRSDEHDAHRWASVEDCLETLAFEDLRRMLRRAAARLAEGPREDPE